MATIGEAQVRITADARGFARDAEREINKEIDRIDLDASTARTFSRAATAGVDAFATTTTAGMLGARGAIIGILATVLIPALIPIGAAMATALLFGFGSVIAGIGLIAAAQSQRVQNEFAGLFRDLGNQMQVISRPFIASLLAIAGIIEDVFGPFRVAFRSAFEDLAPAITAFAQQLGEAFVALAPTIAPITAAFILLLEELGPQLANDVFPALADAIIGLAETIGANAETFASILAFFLRIPEFIVEALTFLAELAAWFAEHPVAMKAAIVVLAGILTLFVAVLAGVAAGVLALVTPFIAIIGIVVAAGTAIVLFRDRIKAALLATAVAISDFVVGVRQRFADFGAAVREGFNRIVDGARALPGRVGSAVSGIAGRIFGPFRDGINRIIDGWNRLSFSLPSIDLGPLGSFGGFSVGTPNIPRLQRGGIVERSGAAVVGEAGPELLFLPPAAVVSPLPSGGGNSDEPMMLEGNLFLDSGEFLGIVRGEISASNGRVARNARSGAGRGFAGLGR